MMELRKHLTRNLLAILLVSFVWVLVAAKPASAAYSGDNLIDSTAFLNSASMSANDIQNFLVSKGSGLANRSFVLNCYGQDSKERQWYTAIGAPCDQNIPASHIIYYASQIYGINPQVALATMQKEQSLITTANPTDWQINQAMGYGCPTSGGCGASNFFYQIDSGIWVLRYHYERARGNTTWWNNNANWTCGTAKQYYTPNLYPGQNVNFYDGNGTHYRTHYLHNAATSSLYCYTPHAYNNPNGLHGLPAYGHTGMYYSGSYHFVRWFQQWFDPISTIAGSLTMQNISQPDLSPARGQTVSYTFSLTNTLSDSLTLDAVGVVGRVGDVRSAHVRDFGWQGPVTFASGETKQFTFTTGIYDAGTLYAWPAVNYKGYYLHFNNWGAALTIHEPNISLVAPLTSSVISPVAGQTATVSATIRSNEDEPINMSAVGLPIRFYGVYNYDAVWMTPSGSLLQPGATQNLSGSVFFDKPGPFTIWVSGLIAGRYTMLSSALHLNVVQPTPHFSLTYTEIPNLNPAVGEDVTIQFKLKNNMPVAMSLNAVGVVGRYGSPSNGVNDDFGWVGPETFSPGQEKSYSFTHNVRDTGSLYTWVAVNYQGSYIHYNTWGFMVAPHPPNLTLSAPLTVNAGSPAYGQTNTVTATVKNNEPKPIKFSALGIPIRYYGAYNYDATWQPSGTLAAAGQAGDTINLSGSVNFDKHGPYTVWTSINIHGRYFTIGIPLNLNL